MPLRYTRKQAAKLTTPAVAAPAPRSEAKRKKAATDSAARPGSAPREQDIQNAILDTLARLGVFALRLNSGAIKTQHGGMVRGCPAGTPDILSIINGAAVFFEVKRPGKKPTPIQEAMHERLRQSGARVYVVTSVDDLLEMLP